jgi:hypothetical protein
VLIGDQPGSIKVRVSDGAGKNFDEVTITITPAKPKPPSGQKTGLLEPMDETGGPITEPEEVQAMVQTLAEDTTGFPRAEPVGGSRARARRADRS